MLWSPARCSQGLTFPLSYAHAVSTDEGLDLPLRGQRKSPEAKRNSSPFSKLKLKTLRKCLNHL